MLLIQNEVLLGDDLNGILHWDLELGVPATHLLELLDTKVKELSLDLG